MHLFINMSGRGFRGNSICEELKVGCVQMVSIKSPAVSSKTHQRGKERVLPTKMYGSVLEGLSPASASTEEGTTQLWSCMLLHAPMMRMMGKARSTAQQLSQRKALVHRHLGSLAGCPNLGCEKGQLSGVQKSTCKRQHLGGGA